MWSDDNFFLVEMKRLIPVLREAEKTMIMLKLQAKATKQFLFVPGTGRRPKSSPCKVPDTERSDWFCNWRADHPTATFCGKPLQLRQSVLALGRLMGPALHRHPKQAVWAKRKAEGALKFLGWIGAFAESSSHKLARLMTTYLVHSVICAAVLNTHLNKEDYQELRKVPAMIARKAVWAGARVAQMVIHRELNWKLVDEVIWLAKIGLHETLKRLPAREYGSNVLSARMRAVQTGVDARGLCAETQNFWRRVGNEQAWEWTGDESKQTRKKRVKPFIAEWIQGIWEEWCYEKASENGDYDRLCPPVGHEAEHISNGTKKQVGLMITARAGACICRGNKTADAKTTLLERTCSLCNAGVVEDEAHILLECQRYEVQRIQMIRTVRQNWSAGHWQLFSEADRRHQKLYLLGLTLPSPGVQKPERLRVDLAVKVFLEQVNELRKESFGLADFCGKAAIPTEGSIDEAYQWSEEARKAYWSLGEDIQSDSESDEQ
jgi:hypothetical protein